jgi:hypothetical protein
MARRWKGWLRRITSSAAATLTLATNITVADFYLAAKRCNGGCRSATSIALVALPLPAMKAPYADNRS